MEDMVGRSPNPDVDRPLLLKLCDPKDPSSSELVRHLHTRAEWRRLPLRELLPGLDLVDSPSFTDRLGVRAANCIGQAKARTLTWLASLTPDAICHRPNVGKKTLEEILGAVVAEWASAYLWQAQSGSSAGGSTKEPQWANKRPRDRSLSSAFADLERAPGFTVFKQRQLESEEGPTLKEAAAKLGISGSRVGQKEAAIRALLSRRMRDSEWPIRLAAERLQRCLGSVAHRAELIDALAEVDGDEGALFDALPHRSALLLWLSGYRVAGEWVLGPDIEDLTTTVLRALTERGLASVDQVGQHLSRLGVREELQLPWILSQYGFRILDGELMRI
jgi:Bacterial RNA polymerase, alpha chain C terminal domain